MKIGIMGGTFNPIHIGHLLLAEAALSQAGLEKVMFLPSGHSYMKQETGVLKADYRIKMVELAISDNPAFFASDMEIKRAGNTYTCDTLLQLKKENPQNTYFFIMGADCLFSIETWKQPQCIFDNCTILAAVRNGISISLMQDKCSYLKEKYRAEVMLLSFPETAISSTDIRELVLAGKSIRYMVPDAVRMYIEENGLYR
ncbi:MAG: nicotinate-nucleotide adenylyltransferase [Lachnospiraceae bacterium]